MLKKRTIFLPIIVQSLAPFRVHSLIIRACNLPLTLIIFLLFFPHLQDERFNREIDLVTGYRTKALLCMPIKDASGDVIGVAQVINKLGGEQCFTTIDEKVSQIIFLPSPKGKSKKKETTKISQYFRIFLERKIHFER